MGEHDTPEALVDGDHDMPTEAEIQAMREEAENFRLPAPAPIPVRGRYYLTECEYCGWVGSSEQCGGSCGPDDDDVICPVCCSSICGDSPDEADTAKHGEAVYQRIVTAEAERDAALAAHQQVTAERDEADRRAGAAEREAERDREDARKRSAWLHQAKQQAGYSTNVSFDKVWAETLEKATRADAASSELARLRAEGEAKDRDNAATALMVIALCNSVLGNAYLGKDGEEDLAGHVKAAFTKPALARAATAREG